MGNNELFNRQEDGKFYFDLISTTEPTRHLAADTEQDAISWRHTLESVINARDEARVSMRESQELTEADNVHKFQAIIKQGPRGVGLGLGIKMRSDGSIYIENVVSDGAKE